MVGEVRAVSSRQFEHARMGAGRWERSLPQAARLVSQSLDRLTTADGSSPCPHLFEPWTRFFRPWHRVAMRAVIYDKAGEYGAEASI